MSSSAFTPLKTGLTRVFIIEGRARPDHVPTYLASLMMAGLSQDFGDVEKIETPDPDNYDRWIEIGQIRGANERMTTTLTGRYAVDLKSTLLRLAKRGCPVDVHLHMGSCDDPRNFNEFDKAIVIESVFLTNYSSDDLGALASGDNASVNESADISGREFYEIMQLNTTAVAGATVTNEVIAVIICGNASCGDCDEENDGCEEIYALTLAAGGSPSTPADIVFSLDKGVTWAAHDVDSLGASDAPTDVACLGLYIVVSSTAGAAGSLNYALLSEFKNDGDPDFTLITTGLVAGGDPLALDEAGGRMYIVGQGGFIYHTDDVTAGATVDDAGVAVADDLQDVSALSNSFAVAVGNAGAVVKTEDGELWAEVLPRPVGVGVNLTAVAVKSKREWLIGTNGGQIFHTIDGGTSWTEKTFSGSGTGVVRDIQFSSDSIVYMSHDTTTPVGRIFRSYDGGNTWVLVPEGTAALPDNDRITAIAACADDQNFMVGGGLGANGADGILIVGKN